MNTNNENLINWHIDLHCSMELFIVSIVEKIKRNVDTQSDIYTTCESESKSLTIYFVPYII